MSSRRYLSRPIFTARGAVRCLNRALLRRQLRRAARACAPGFGGAPTRFIGWRSPGRRWKMGVIAVAKTHGSETAWRTTRKRLGSCWLDHPLRKPSPGSAGPKIGHRSSARVAIGDRADARENLVAISAPIHHVHETSLGSARPQNRGYSSRIFRTSAAETRDGFAPKRAVT